MKDRRSAGEVGREGEEAAAAYLASRGYRIVERNLRLRAGEIDLVAEESGYLVFVEVKTRRSTGFGTAAEAVTAQKRRQLIRLAALYLARRGGAPPPCRFDVVTVEPGPDGQWVCQVIQGAFVS
ncbi:MAG: YraN family protein [Bacillota bacterium]